MSMFKKKQRSAIEEAVAQTNEQNRDVEVAFQVKVDPDTSTIGLNVRWAKKGTEEGNLFFDRAKAEDAMAKCAAALGFVG